MFVVVDLKSIGFGMRNLRLWRQRQSPLPLVWGKEVSSNDSIGVLPLGGIQTAFQNGRIVAAGVPLLLRYCSAVLTGGRAQQNSLAGLSQVPKLK